MIRYSLKQLSYFVVAAELKSTSAAARVLHVSQPSISAAIQHLEGVFAKTLIIRHKGQGITPTTYGRELMQESRQLLNLAYTLGQDSAHPTHGSVRIGCFVDISPFYLPEILYTLKQRYPDIEPRITNGELNEIPALIKRGELDMAITYGVLLEDGIVYKRLRTQTPHAMLHANHPLAKLERIPLEALMQGKRQKIPIYLS